MKSKYQDRDTVGSIYNQAQNNDVKGLLIGDVNSEMLQGLCDDINASIESNPFNDREFYISVVEERDLQMPNAFKRRLFVSLYRPYPEDNTLVFKVNPKTTEVFYCWDMPHHSEMWNILSNFTLYDKEYIKKIGEWQRNDLTNFGFEKTMDGENWIPNPNFMDKPINFKPRVNLIV